MNKNLKLFFVFGVVLLFSISLISVNADAWSLKDWLKSIFIKKNVQPVQAQPYNKVPENVPNYGNIDFLDTLKNKCVINNRILNYCRGGDLKTWNKYSNPYWKYNEYGYLSYGNSMTPLIKIGDRLAVRKYRNGVDTDKLYSCEIIKFKSPKTGELFYHRIIGFTSKGEIVTRGDANSLNDYEIIEYKDVDSRVCGVIKNE